MARQHPVGKAQQLVLDAIGKAANSFDEADEIFAEVGISVSSRRQGRTSVPVVTVLSGSIGGFAGGDGDSCDRDFDEAAIEKLSQWIVK